MFFWRNKHMMCDFGTGNNNKLNWVLEDKQELIDILETVYRGAKKGRGLVVSPKGRSSWESCGWVCPGANKNMYRLLYEISLLKAWSCLGMDPSGNLLTFAIRQVPQMR